MVLQMNAINGGEKKIVCNVVYIHLHRNVIHIYYIYLHTINNIKKCKKNGWFVQCTVTHTQIYTSTNINNFNQTTITT